MGTPIQTPELARKVIHDLISECQKSIVGKRELIEDLLVALLSEGHVLLEGVPGVAKTTLGKTFAKTLGLAFNRIQGSPDMLPADIVGTHVFDPETKLFKLAKGPIFTNILLIDEVNRNTPKTNSAVLEAMQERQVTIEGDTQRLPSPFMVVATMSPVEFHGVFPLPEVLVDRFLLRLNVSYPTILEEVEVAGRIQEIEMADIRQIVTGKQLSYLIELVKCVFLAPQVQRYIVDLVHKTRAKEQIRMGASPRASIALSKASRARALIRGRLYVLPDDVKYLANRVLNHRLVLSTETRIEPLSAEKVVNMLLEETPIPKRLLQT